MLPTPLAVRTLCRTVSLRRHGRRLRTRTVDRATIWHLRICHSQRLIDLVRRNRLAALNPAHEILELCPFYPYTWSEPGLSGVRESVGRLAPLVLGALLPSPPFDQLTDLSAHQPDPPIWG